jgi:hypothetical protein
MEETALTPDDLERFQYLTKFPITDYLTSFQSFITNDAPLIIAYYNGDIKSLNQASNTNLQNLIMQSQACFMAIANNNTALRNYKWWVLIEQLEEMDNLLLKFNTISKWLRSSITNGNYSTNPPVQVKFNQGQTLEMIERNILGDVNGWDDDWIDLALKNNLREEDYTSDAGFLLTVNYNYTVNNVKPNSIVDNPIGTKVLGIDLQAQLQFDSVAQDYVVLTPQQTFFQTVATLINLRQGDNPEFPNEGITASLIVGSNVGSLSYPAIFRQLQQLFKGDDTIASFTLNNLSRQQDGVFLKFTVKSLYGLLQQSTTLNLNQS